MCGLEPSKQSPAGRWGTAIDLSDLHRRLSFGWSRLLRRRRLVCGHISRALLGPLRSCGLLRSRLLRCLGRALGRTLDQLLLGHLERAFRRRLVEAEDRDLKGAERVVTSEDVVVSVVVAPVVGRREALRILLGLGILYVNKLLVRTR